VGKGSKKTFLKRRHKNNQQVYTEMLNIYFGEIQSKTTLRYHLHLIKIAVIQKMKDNKYWRVYGGKVFFVNYY
jgi:DNA helicase TIP49 (TBP-interacting protein)